MINYYSLCLEGVTELSMSVSIQDFHDIILSFEGPRLGLYSSLNTGF